MRKVFPSRAYLVSREKFPIFTSVSRVFFSFQQMMTMDVTKPEPPSGGGAAGLSGGSVASNGPNGSQQNPGASGPGQNGINGNGPHSHNHNQQLCAGCGKHIQDRFLLRALDLLWHEDCLKCGCCDCRLGEVGSTLYTKGNLMLCKRDYLR